MLPQSEIVARRGSRALPLGPGAQRISASWQPVDGQPTAPGIRAVAVLPAGANVSGGLRVHQLRRPGVQCGLGGRVPVGQPWKSPRRDPSSRPLRLPPVTGRHHGLSHRGCVAPAHASGCCRWPGELQIESSSIWALGSGVAVGVTRAAQAHDLVAELRGRIEDRTRRVLGSRQSWRRRQRTAGQHGISSSAAVQHPRRLRRP